MTKGKKPVMKRIDHADLFLLDEIRGFGERGSKECFEEAAGCPICEFESAGEAFKAALRDRGDEKEENLLCLGSLYLVGEVKELAATMF